MFGATVNKQPLTHNDNVEETRSRRGRSSFALQDNVRYEVCVKGLPGRTITDGVEQHTNAHSD